MQKDMRTASQSMVSPVSALVFLFSMDVFVTDTLLSPWECLAGW